VWVVDRRGWLARLRSAVAGLDRSAS